MEYGLIAALLSITIVTAVSLVGDEVAGLWQGVADDVAAALAPGD